MLNRSLIVKTKKHLLDVAVVAVQLVLKVENLNKES